MPDVVVLPPPGDDPMTDEGVAGAVMDALADAGTRGMTVRELTTALHRDVDNFKGLSKYQVQRVVAELGEHGIILAHATCAGAWVLS